MSWCYHLVCWVLCAVVGTSFIVSPVRAVACSCFRGQPVSSRSCDCACDAGFLAPTCTFGVADSVEIIFYLNVSSDEFQSELFANATAFAAAAEALFLRAKNISKFRVTSCTVSIPGYAVSRLLTSVEVRDPWVAEYRVVSAHVVTPSPRVASKTTFGVSFDQVLYDSPSFIITINSILWFVLAAVLCLLLIGIEETLSTNTEAIVEPGSLRHRRSSRRLIRKESLSSMRNDETGSDVMVKQIVHVSSNLNEHRRPAPPPATSLPMQILDDFVDSDDDDTAQRKSSSNPSSKYSLGKRVEGSKQGSPAGSPKSSRSASPHKQKKTRQ